MSIREILHLFDIGKITVSLCAKSLEIERDHFAIEFARWIQAHPIIFNNGSSMVQALEIYKKEKGL